MSRKTTGSLSGRVTVRDLTDLAAMEGAGASEHLARIYVWKYESATVLARAVAGVGVAVVLATLLPVIQPDSHQPISSRAVIISWAAAALLVTIGSYRYLAARRIYREFIAAQSLLAELIAIRPFLVRYRRSES